jgi:hypothetical protein
MLDIRITREDNHLGFGLKVRGVYDNTARVYDGTYGNLKVLRMAVVGLLDKIEVNEAEYLSAVADSKANSAIRRKSAAEALKEHLTQKSTR